MKSGVVYLIDQPSAVAGVSTELAGGPSIHDKRIVKHPPRNQVTLGCSAVHIPSRHTEQARWWRHALTIDPEPEGAEVTGYTYSSRHRAHLPSTGDQHAVGALQTYRADPPLGDHATSTSEPLPTELTL